MSQELKQINNAPACGACQNGNSNGVGIELTMAFQPIVNVATQTVFAYEALVRGVNGASAGQVLALVNEENRYAFDQSCRVKSIELAAELGVAAQGAKLAVNFMPGAVYSPAACIRRTLETARKTSFPLDAIIFEIMENEQVVDSGHLQRIAEEYARHGFTLALDDFGAGYSGLNLLAELDGVRLVKLDGKLIRGIDRNPRAEHVVAAAASMCRELGVEVLGECVETIGEYETLQRCGIDLMQGYLFAKPAVEALPAVQWPESYAGLTANASSSFGFAPSLA